MLSPAEVAELPGIVPLPPSVVAALPGSTPAPPWRCRVEALLWWHRAVEPAAAALPPALRERRLSWVTVGAFVRYLDSPVGPYSEVLASPVMVAGRFGIPSMAIPFIAVDSVPSIHGGRAHWALPKVPAAFEWPTLARVTASGVPALPAHPTGQAGWSVAGTLSARGPRLPFFGWLPSVHAMPGGDVFTSRTFQRATGRLGRLDISVTGEALTPWLLPGSHRCLEITNATMVVGPAR